MTVSFDKTDPSLGITHNAFSQPVGKPIPGWSGCKRLPDVELTGRYCRLVPFRREHADALFDAYGEDDGRMWTYMPFGPFAIASDLRASITDHMLNKGFQTFVIMQGEDESPIGHASFMRYDMPNGSVEVGGVCFSPHLQRSTVATEAMYLMMKHAFNHGYRRYEWKCDQLNAASNNAAQRLGFQFEGVFRNAIVYKGRRRDTAWYAVIVEDWAKVAKRLEAWLDPANFDDDGTQKVALSVMPVE